MGYVGYFVSIASIVLTLSVYAYRYWKRIRYLWHRLRQPDNPRRGFDVLPPRKRK